MSLSAALNSSLSSLLTLQQQTRVVSANVANAQSQDYTKKTANLVTPAIQGLPAGVQIQSVTRTVNATLQNDLLGRTATAARLEVVRNRQAQLSASVDLFKALGGGWAGTGTP